MRSLQECQAEVFRRSEKRIRTRRRAIRAVMVCVPLVLCLTAFGLLGAARTTILSRWSSAEEQRRIPSPGCLPH